MRNSELSRETKETSVRICLDLDGSGDVSIDTGIPFLDHMLCAFGKHGRMDLVVKARGDLEILDTCDTCNIHSLSFPLNNSISYSEMYFLTHINQ